MNNRPIVSVLTPCKNRALYLESCIQSVVAQSYPFVEHLIQDGASTDGTLDILRRYSEHVQWVSEPDMNEAQALDRALKRSRGDIFIVLNSDDQLMPDACAWGVRHMQQFTQAAAIYGDQYWMNAEGRVYAKCLGPHPYDFERVFCARDVIPAQSAFIRRTHLEKVGFYADKCKDVCADYEMWIRLGLKFSMKYVPGFVSKYRKHSGSQSCQIEMFEAMMQSKLGVVNEVLRSHETSLEVKNLGKKAHIGILTWGALNYVEYGAFRSAFSTYLKALLSRAKKSWIFIPAQIVFFLLRVVKSTSHTRRVFSRI